MILGASRCTWRTHVGLASHQTPWCALQGSALQHEKGPDGQETSRRARSKRAVGCVGPKLPCRASTARPTEAKSLNSRNPTETKAARQQLILCAANSMRRRDMSSIVTRTTGNENEERDTRRGDAPKKTNTDQKNKRHIPRHTHTHTKKVTKPLIAIIEAHLSNCFPMSFDCKTSPMHAPLLHVIALRVAVTSHQFAAHDSAQCAADPVTPTCLLGQRVGEISRRNAADPTFPFLWS